MTGYGGAFGQFHRSAAVFLAALAATSACAADVPRGRKDFVPTPQRPIGFCGDGNSWWPAANPPAEWWDGTPGIAKVRFRGGTGSTSPPFDDGSTQVEMRVLLDRAPKNILWKPGWSLSHSIVVGTKVFVVCAAGSPEGQDCAQLLCYSADTGKELWRRHSGS